MFLPPIKIHKIIYFTYNIYIYIYIYIYNDTDSGKNHTLFSIVLKSTWSLSVNNSQSALRLVLLGNFGSNFKLICR